MADFLASYVGFQLWLLNPACVEYMLAEVARGVSAGLLLASVRVLVVVRRPKLVCEPFSCWSRFAWAATWHEVKYGLVAGYLLGLCR